MTVASEWTKYIGAIDSRRVERIEDKGVKREKTDVPLSVLVKNEMWKRRRTCR